jgi:hypothetical protein
MNNADTCSQHTGFTVIGRDLHHGGEIGCLGDLYRVSQEKPV